MQKLYAPFPQIFNSCNTCEFEATIRPKDRTMPASVARLTTTILRRLRASIRRWVSGVSAGTGFFSRMRAVRSSGSGGDGRGDEDPDRGSLMPLNPLCKFDLGAGNPLK